MMYPPRCGRSELKVGRGGDLLLRPRPRPGSGEDAIPSEVEVEAKP
jgi:hypothetical protein